MADSRGSRLSRITPADLVALGLAFAFGLYLVASGSSGSCAGASVVITTLGGQEVSLPLDRDACLDVDGLLGRTTVEITGGSVRFAGSPCPNKVCVRKGKVSRPGEWIACVPNGVVARISGEASYDCVTP